jgi:hypothetical protein
MRNSLEVKKVDTKDTDSASNRVESIHEKAKEI